MPGRPHLLLNNYIYHIYNKTINGKKIFDRDENSKKFLENIWYYRSISSSLRLSNFIKISSELKNSYIEKINKISSFRISILTYILMPTHYHFILKQNYESGISSFISLIQNSFTRYYNIKNKLNGPIFMHRFKSKPITSEEQLKHTSRYIHLNPYSSNLVNKLIDLEKYKWSSYKEFITLPKRALCEYNQILLLFNNNPLMYKKFVMNNADYQKTLEICKYIKKHL